MNDSTNYEAVLSAKACSFLVRLPKAKQKELFNLLSQLSKTPSQLGDYTERDGSGRDVQFIRLGEYVITFWPDLAVKEFRIINIDCV